MVNNYIFLLQFIIVFLFSTQKYHIVMEENTTTKTNKY